MKERLAKAFGYVLFFTLALGSCMLAGSLVYLFVSNVLPVPADLPSELPTSGPSPTPTPTNTPTSTIAPTPTITPTPTPAPYSIEIRNRTGDETVGERLASYLSDAGYNVVKVSTGSTITDFGNTLTRSGFGPMISQALSVHSQGIYAGFWTSIANCGPVMPAISM